VSGLKEIGQIAGGLTNVIKVGGEEWNPLKCGSHICSNNTRSVRMFWSQWRLCREGASKI